MQTPKVHLTNDLAKCTPTYIDDYHSLQYWTRLLSLFDVTRSVIILTPPPHIPCSLTQVDSLYLKHDSQNISEGGGA